MDATGKALGKVSVNKILDLNGGTDQSAHSSLVLTTRAPREGVSYGLCSKLCAIFFVAGVVFGYTQRGRVSRWASKVLKRFTDN